MTPPLSARQRARIVRAAIHPAIGIARIGDSQKYFIGPEVTEPRLRASHRDKAGKLLRQAARFRIYGYDANGKVVGELTHADAEITWSVHLANKKAAWYRCLCPLDLPETNLVEVARRNPQVPFSLRNTLVIDAQEQAIAGKPRMKPVLARGSFQGTSVQLGELYTDAEGRLVVLGGTGVAGSPSGAPPYGGDMDSVGNSDGWFDDTSDGPVSATVRMKQGPVEVEGAWVVVAPPNYAPGIVGWRTLYECLHDSFVEAKMLPSPPAVSFVRDILPVLQRLSQLQWVNEGFAALFGHGRPLDFNNSDLIAKLAHQPSPAGDPYGALRRIIFRSFRPARNTDEKKDSRLQELEAWPWFYGDTILLNWDARLATDYIAWSPLREKMMKDWADGAFVNDWPRRRPPPKAIANVPLAEQPGMLDKAALHFCLADAFHPGCELSWPIRHVTMFDRPYRIRRRPAQQKEPDYGPVLNQTIVSRGPLDAQGPGDLTRWLPVPWAADLPFCRSGYNPDYDSALPAFWPARVPNQILTQKDYAIVTNRSARLSKRLAAFHRRESWYHELLKKIDGDPEAAIRKFLTAFGEMGVVERRPGPKNDPHFPTVMFVESIFAAKLRKVASRLAGAAALRPRAQLDPIRRAGWDTEKQWRSFRAYRYRRR
jgi:hypothetical protein